jgi:hypothetical protein
MAVSLRFIFLAIPGLITFLVFSLALFLEIDEKGFTKIHPALSSVIALLGILMMLYGAGLWKQWRYIWVFISIPLSIFLYEIINVEIIDSKADIGLVSGIVAAFTLGLVRISYKKSA